jgi:uncharacterized protein (DUF169 family)
MTIMFIRSQMPAPLVASPAEQQRVCHCCRHCERARGTSQRTSIYAEVATRCCPGGSLNPGINTRMRRDRPQSP